MSGLWRVDYTAAMVFLNVLFPILVLVVIGYVMARTGHLRSDELAKLNFWILSPALIFTGLVENEIELRVFLDYGIFILVLSIVFMIVGFGLSRLRGLSVDSTSALTLALLLPNTGNYGLPLLLFAFGDPGFALGVVYLSVSTLVMSTLGIAVATWGGEWSWKPFVNIGKTPLFYAVLLAVVVRMASVEMPLFVVRPLQLLSDAAIPAMLLLLGTQLVGVGLGRRRVLIGQATALRLGLAPFAAWGLATLMGFEGLTHAAATIEASMPTAVNAVVIATVYNRDPRLVSSVVLATTAFSVLTLGVLLMLIGNAG